MTKKPETVKEEDLIKRKDGLYYKKYARVPFTGAAKDFYENGQLKIRGNFKDGKEDGLGERFYENGQLERRKNWKDGKEDGLWEWFDDNGQLTKTETWKNGELAEEN